MMTLTAAGSGAGDDAGRGRGGGHGDREVHKVLVALDPFDEVCQEAADMGADLLVTHHALIGEAGFVTDESLWGRRALFLIENGIAHINAHTNLDCAPGGVNDILAQNLGLQDIQVIEPVGEDEDVVQAEKGAGGFRNGHSAPPPSLRSMSLRSLRMWVPRSMESSAWKTSSGV